MLGWFKKRILRSLVASSLSGPRIIRAKYDAANPQDADNDEHWRRGVDSYAADMANSPAVRKRLRERARYETDNNSYLFGVVDTLVNDMVGSGPMLQLSGDPDIPTSVAKFAEMEWEQWRLYSGFDEALQTLDRSKRIDGESFGLLTDNPAIPGPVKLVLQTVESEQVTDPSASNDPKNIDGVLLNDAGHVVGYQMLKTHPGGMAPSLETKSVKPESMIHWFRPRRPGQHRGTTDLVACLKLMPMLRRYTLATVRTAEIQASNGGVLETDVEPGDFDPSVLPEDTINYVRGMITALPPGYKFRGFEPTQPIANMDMFVRTLLQEAGRGLNVPLVVMLMNASGFNFASGRLDHLIYWKGQRIDRARFIKRVVHPIFRAWWREWRFARNMSHLKDMPAAEFIFPGFEFLDVKNETAANVEQIGAGLSTPEDFWTASGKDPEKMRRKVEKWAKWGKEQGFMSAPATSTVPVEPAKEKETPIRAAWNESDHPRDDVGQFTDSGSSGGGGSKRGGPYDYPVSYKPKSTDKVQDSRTKATIEEYQRRIADALPASRQAQDDANKAFSELKLAADRDGVDLGLMNDSKNRSEKLRTQADFLEQHIGTVTHGRQKYDLTDRKKTRETIEELRTSATRFERYHKKELAKSPRVEDLNKKAWAAYDRADEIGSHVAGMIDRVDELFWRDKERKGK